MCLAVSFSLTPFCSLVAFQLSIHRTLTLDLALREAPFFDLSRNESVHTNKLRR